MKTAYTSIYNYIRNFIVVLFYYRNGVCCSGRVATSVWTVHFIYGPNGVRCVWNIKAYISRYVSITSDSMIVMIRVKMH